MKYDPRIHHRQSIRLKYNDYTTVGMYFITICVQNRKRILGNIHRGKIELSNIGKIVEKEILLTNKIRQNAIIDKYVIMPNHVHFIINITEKINSASGVCNTPLQTPKNTIGAMIKWIKGAVSKKIGYSIWQRNYYEHVIRNEKEYYKILEYIEVNPIKWEKDIYYKEGEF